MIKPIAIPIGKNKMGSQIGPINVPIKVKVGEMIRPTVTKYAEKTNGRNEKGLSTPSASL